MNTYHTLNNMPQIRHAYRRLVKAASTAFKNDEKALSLAKVQIRDGLMKNKDVSDPTEIKALIETMSELEEMLRFHVVQGKLNSDGNYAVELSEEHIVTVQDGQRMPNGPELAPVDTSILGKPVIIEKVKGSQTKKELDLPQS